MLAIVDWSGAVIVAVALIALITVIMVVAIVRYEVDQVLKIWGGLGALTGLIAGSIGSYFFTKPQIQQAQQQVAQVQQASARAHDALTQASHVLDTTVFSMATSQPTRPTRELATEFAHLERLIDSARVETEASAQK